MSRRTASGPGNSFADVIGVALLALALLLLVAQWSFDRHDISWLGDPHNKYAHNWIKLPGAYLAWGSFLLLGIAAYLLPLVLAAFGSAYLLNFPGYLRERSRWSVLWSAILLISLTGLLYLADNGGLRGKIHVTIGAQSIGGLLGWATYGEIRHPNYNLQFGFSLLGPIGATIVYGALGLISLLFLTDFRLGEWIRAFLRRKIRRQRTKTGRGKRARPPRPRTRKDRRSNCRRKSPAPASARTASPCPNRPCAI